MTDQDRLADEISALAAKATNGDLTTAQRHIPMETVECPFCSDGEIEASDYCNFDSKALGVQFYGIGEEFGAHERLWTKVMANLDTIISGLRSPSGSEGEAVAELIEPWKDYRGDLPDFDHPLRCVFEAGIQYAVELLAKTLNVEDWENCDGTEEFDGDLSGTMFNIVLGAMPIDEDGDPLHPNEVRALYSAHPATPKADDDDEGPCTDCYDTGITIQTDRRCSCQPDPTVKPGLTAATPSGADEGVTQSDREFLASVGLWSSTQKALILSGQHDDDFGALKAVAAFRLTSANPARTEALEEAAKRIQMLKRSIMIDVGSCHSLRGPGASSEMRSDDRDMRADMEEAFSMIDRALQTKGG